MLRGQYASPALSIPALYALTAYYNPNSRFAEGNKRKARALAYACYEMFRSTTSGLAADKVFFSEDRDFETGPIGIEYKLRGETIETFFVLYHMTKDPIYMWDEGRGNER